jgi:hypothetical protein
MKYVLIILLVSWGFPRHATATSQGIRLIDPATPTYIYIKSTKIVCFFFVLLTHTFCRTAAHLLMVGKKKIKLVSAPPQHFLPDQQLMLKILRRMKIVRLHNLWTGRGFYVYNKSNSNFISLSFNKRPLILLLVSPPWASWSFLRFAPGDTQERSPMEFALDLRALNS